MKKFPVITAIKTFADVKRAIDSLRDYFETTPSVGKVIVTQPQTQSTLTIIDSKELKVIENWELRDINGGVTGQALDTTKFVEVIIKGLKVKLAVLQ
jgi:hypothetical protein